MTLTGGVNADFVRSMVDGAEARDLSVLVKPHPKDAEDWQRTPLGVLDEALCTMDGYSWYEVLGTASGIVADYSSVWLDYLILDRPIGFYVPDFEDYEAHRGFKVDGLRGLLPGPILSDHADVDDFLDVVATSEDPWSDRRARARRSLGLVAPDSAVNDLFAVVRAELDRRRVKVSLQ